MSTKETLSLLTKNSNLNIPGFTLRESAEALSLAVANNRNYAGKPTEDLLAKSRETRWPDLSKSVLGGIQHVVSVDNGAYYAELWSKAGNWYAVTGAELSKSLDEGSTSPYGSIYEIAGVTKGMKLPEASVRFVEAFSNNMKLSKGKPCNCADK